MNGEEKKVLRRKRQTLVTFLKVTERHLETLVKDNNLSQDAANQIRGELSNQAKVNKLLEVLPSCCGRRAWGALCGLLEGGPAGWLRDELAAELRAEKGDLRLEDYIDRECGVLVYREFGNSKRLSEGEKKDMQLLVARKTQCTKEAWRSQLARTEEALAYESELNTERDEQAQGLADSIRSFLGVHAGRLSIVRAPREEDADGPLMPTLAALTSDLQNLVTDALLERDRLLDDRQRSLRLLSVTDPAAKLEAEISLTIEEADHRLQESQREADAHQTRARALDDQLNTANLKWTREVEQRDNSLRTLRGHLDTCHAKIRELSGALDAANHDLANTRDELARYRSKSDLLEKSRRLGYGGDGSDKGRRPPGDGPPSGRSRTDGTVAHGRNTDTATGRRTNTDTHRTESRGNTTHKKNKKPAKIHRP